ncbi:hypothetical protein CBR_g16040 [Chara braunii]|uniref:Reverse transcriptase RNase H-like domain-containing protein n=1 Tax=Chara braunii TaxID=69332 RepID=A0A388JSX2_CHABU|nr:hypothetical protein CBR_g16040 [Chara braunii]|eukprot:GBG60919.1 hypothetical protein CBR_g16040 [Chara braunii]
MKTSNPTAAAAASRRPSSSPLSPSPGRSIPAPISTTFFALLPRWCSPPPGYCRSPRVLPSVLNRAATCWVVTRLVPHVSPAPISSGSTNGIIGAHMLMYGREASDRPMTGRKLADEGMHGCRRGSMDAKATPPPTFAAVVAGDHRGPKILAPSKFKGDDPKIDVGDWTAGTWAYLKGFQCPEQQMVATVVGLLEGPAQKWATSTASAQSQSLEDWALALGADKLLQALEDRFADKERARKAADKIVRLGQQRYSGSLQALFAEFEQLTSTPGLVMSADDLLTSFCRAAPEKFSVALYSAGHKDWRSFGRAALDMEAKLHVQAPSSDKRKGAFPRGGRKGKAAFAYAGSGSSSDPGLALTRALVLKLHDPTLPFVLTTGASQYGIGAVLQQDDGNGLRPVEFMSKKIKTHKLQDSAYEKELYALVSALKHWKHFLLGRHFKIFSDHSTLQWLKSQGELNDKLARYIQFIDLFDFELKHKKGCYNKVADALSRRPDSFALISSTHSFGEDVCQTIARLLPQDPTYGPIVRNLRADPNSEPSYALSSDLLYTYSRGEERLCIPEDQQLRTLLMSECHDACGHFGFLKSYAALSQRFFWKEMRSDMLRYVDTCELCQRNKVQRKPPLGFCSNLCPYLMVVPSQCLLISQT